MFNNIIKIDEQLFFYINQGMQSKLLDKWMPIITDVGNWTWLFIIGFVVLFLFGGTKGKIACIVAGITVLVADNFNSYILKEWVGRLRPQLVLEGVRLLGDHSNKIPSPSFPSGHATNIFALAMVLSWYYPKTAFIWFLVAITVSFSRIYLGLHYPLDVISGALFGILWALIFIWCARIITIYINKKRKGALYG